MNLNDKRNRLQRFYLSRVAVPTADEYAFRTEDKELAELLTRAVNKILTLALKRVKRAADFVPSANFRAPSQNCGPTPNEIQKCFLPQLGELRQRYRNVGFYEPEFWEAVATFWALNYSPDVYDSMLHPNRWLLEPSPPFPDDLP